MKEKPPQLCSLTSLLLPACLSRMATCIFPTFGSSAQGPTAPSKHLLGKGAAEVTVRNQQAPSVASTCGSGLQRRPRGPNPGQQDAQLMGRDTGFPPPMALAMTFQLHNVAKSDLYTCCISFPSYPRSLNAPGQLVVG